MENRLGIAVFCNLANFVAFAHFFIQSAVPPSFSYGDIRRVLRSPRRAEGGRFFPAWRGNVIQYTYTVGRAGIHAWGNHVRHPIYGWNVAVVEPRNPCPFGLGVRHIP